MYDVSNIVSQNSLPDIEQGYYVKLLQQGSAILLECTKEYTPSQRKEQVVDYAVNYLEVDLGSQIYIDICEMYDIYLPLILNVKCTRDEPHHEVCTATREMTMQQICESFGCDIKIVS